MGGKGKAVVCGVPCRAALCCAVPCRAVPWWLCRAVVVGSRRKGPCSADPRSEVDNGHRRAQ